MTLWRRGRRRRDIRLGAVATQAAELLRRTLAHDSNGETALLVAHVQVRIHAPVQHSLDDAFISGHCVEDDMSSNEER